MNKVQLTKEILHELYWNKNLKIDDIAKELGYSRANIRHCMVKFGIERRKKAYHLRREIPVTREILEELYWKQSMSLAEIAEKFNCSVELIFTKMNEFGMERREEYKKGLEISREELNDLYWNKKLSLNQIGEKFGCEETNILYWMKKYGIERRPDNYREVKISKEELYDMYWTKGLTTQEIADKYGIKYGRSILKKLKKYGIQSKTLSEANTVKFKADFSEDLSEKAYLLGLRTGDFHVKKIKLCVRAQTTTTHLAQIELLRKSFEKYGETKTYLSKNHARDNEWFIYTDLNSTFDFLIEKPEAIPPWILENDDYFYQFLCAYSDCEGTFNIVKSHDNSVRFIFKIKSGDKIVLENIKSKLENLGYAPRFYLDCQKGTNRGYGPSNNDIYNLTLYRKENMLRFIQKLIPISKHSEKIRKMKLISENKDDDWLAIFPKLENLRSEFKKEILKNL